jgi:hypothetical protein
MDLFFVKNMKMQIGILFGPYHTVGAAVSPAFVNSFIKMQTFLLAVKEGFMTIFYLTDYE